MPVPKKSRHKNFAKSFLYHPFEVAISGYSNSGKTTLIEKLTSFFAKKYSIGYVKGDHSQFDMDREGKDTSRIWKSGASAVWIEDSQRQGFLGRGERDFIHKKTLLENMELVFIEGHKTAAVDKIVAIDSEQEILKDKNYGDAKHILAFVGPWQNAPSNPTQTPYYHWDDIEGISKQISQRLVEKVNKTPLYGLILAGGQSTRMQRDKALLKYHNRNQVEFSHELLAPHCAEVFVSSQREQFKEFDHIPQINDRFLEVGPMGGILTAMLEKPEAAWLVLACDLPYLDDATLAQLVSGRNPFKLATAFTSANDSLPEPLCAIYEPRSRVRLFEFLGMGYECPRKALINSSIETLTLKNTQALENVNSPGEYQLAQKALNPVNDKESP